MAIPGLVYKICLRTEWQTAVAAGIYTGSADDARDGFIHLSTARQLAGTLARHFRRQSDLALIELATADLGANLRWEPSRGGDLFPHLYAALETRHARRVLAIDVDGDGSHALPVEVDRC